MWRDSFMCHSICDSYESPVLEKLVYTWLDSFICVTYKWLIHMWQGSSTVARGLRGWMPDTWYDAFKYTKEPYKYTKEHCQYQKEPSTCKYIKEPCKYAKEPCKHTQQPCRSCFCVAECTMCDMTYLHVSGVICEWYMHVNTYLRVSWRIFACFLTHEYVSTCVMTHLRVARRICIRIYMCRDAFASSMTHFYTYLLLWGGYD